MAKILESRFFLAKLPPTKTVMCVLRQQSPSSVVAVRAAKDGRIFGTAISDPYLGFARPLASVETLRDVAQLVDEHQPGGLVFLPRQRHLVQRLLLRDGSSPKICTVLEDDPMSIDEAVRRKETEWEMWEEIDDPKDGRASTEAAVALNGWLWTHCGGWRNTFG